MSRTIRKLLGQGDNAPAVDAPSVKRGDEALRKPLAQSPNTTVQNADDGLPISVVRNLIYSGAPEDLAQLRKIVDGMSAKAQSNLMLSIARETRDPQSPAKAIRLTPEGQMLVDAVFNKVDPDPSWIANKPVTPGGGTRLDLVSAEADMEPKPFRPASVSEDGRDLNDRTRFRSNEDVKEGKDGTVRVTHSDVQVDGQTKRAIDRAKEGLPVGPIYDDAANTPPGRRAGNALAAGTRTPKQEATLLMHRLAETSNPHGVIDSRASNDPLMFEAADGRQDNPSAFAPGNTGSQMKRHVATVRPADHSDAMRAFQTVKRGNATNPNQQFNSAEDFARAFVASTNQEGLNVTPITARERGEATDLLQSYNYDDDFPTYRTSPGLGDNPHGLYLPPQGKMSEAQAGPLLRQNMSDTIKGTQTAERALMQEQTIAALARKFDDIFGHQGWGENYKPSTRPGTDEPAAPAGGIGDGVATTQDPANVPDLGRPNVRAEAPAPKQVVAPGKPGMEIGEDVDADDLADLHQQRVGSEGAPISTEEVEPNFARGRDLGDRTGMGRTKTKELPGNKPGEYQDKRPLAAYNRENRTVSDSDLERRRQFAEQWNKTVGGETERSSVLRQQLRALMESNEPEAPGTSAAAAKATQIADLQRRLRLAERLDSMSGINSMKMNDPETGLIATPTPSNLSPADLNSNKLAASARPLEADEIEVPGAKKFDLDNEPIDAEFEIKRENLDGPAQPDPVATPNTPEPTPESGWKKAAKRAAVVGGVLGGGLGIYELLRQGGQPPVNGGPPTGGGQLDHPLPPGGGPQGPGGYVPYGGPPGGPAGQDLGAKPEDRIRALQNFRMNLNPHTQILQSYTR